MPTPAAQEAPRILRDGSLFQWYVIPLFALAVYTYAVEVEKRNWSLVFAGLAFWGMDRVNEIRVAAFDETFYDILRDV